MRLRAVAVAALLVGCAARQASRDPVAKKLRSLDERYAQAATAADLSPVLQDTVLQLERHPDEPRLLWRLSRALAAQAAWGDPALAGSAYAAAREAGMRCLSLRPGFSAQVITAGGRLVPAAVAQLGAEDLPCATWTLQAWGRALDLRGAGAVDPDLPGLEALAAWAAGVEGAPPAERVWVAGAAGLVLSLRPALDGAPPLPGRPLLEEAVREGPGHLGPLVDLALYGLDPNDDAVLRERLLGEAVRAPEGGDPPGAAGFNAAARARAQKALSTAAPSP
jgi:hypothetical protein